MAQPPRLRPLLRVDRRGWDIGRRHLWRDAVFRLHDVTRFHRIPRGDSLALAFAPVGVVVAVGATVVQPAEATAVSAIAAGLVAIAPAQAEMPAKRPGVG